MSVTNKRKERVCKQYSLYLNIIYQFGNKVMLLKQLYEYAQALGLVNSQPQFYLQIKELIEADILRKEPFVAFGKNTQLHMLIMRKYGIRFIEGKKDSQSVGAVPKANTNERVLISLFKNSYILDKIIPRLKKHYDEISYDRITQMLEQDRSTILYNKNQGLEYLYSWRDSFLNQYCDVNLVEFEISNLEELQKRRKRGLKMGSESSQGKGKGKVSSCAENVLEEVQNRYKRHLEDKRDTFKEDRKYNKLINYNIDSMLNSYSYISQLKEIKGTLTVTVLIFDINNRQDIYKVGMHIASIYHMFFRYLKNEGKLEVPKFKLKVGIVCLDEEAEKNMIVGSRKMVKDYITKEEKGEQLKITLRNWNISDDIQEKYIEVLFTNYNITNRYLDGVKYSNLKRK